MTLQAVVDPNVLVSALISPNGVPARILTASEEGRFRLVVSERLVAELQDVLVRPKFRRYATVEEVQAHVRRVRELGLIYEEGDEFEAVSPDPKDDYCSWAPISQTGKTVSSGWRERLGELPQGPGNFAFVVSACHHIRWMRCHWGLYRAGIV